MNYFLKTVISTTEHRFILISHSCGILEVLAEDLDVFAIS